MKSIFTTDFNVCAVTHIYRGARKIEIHHVFGAANRKKSTRRGFVIPLIAEIHPNGAYRNEAECKRLTGRTLKELDHELKATCQRYYERVYGTRKEFIEEFGRNYL